MPHPADETVCTSIHCLWDAKRHNPKGEKLGKITYTFTFDQPTPLLLYSKYTVAEIQNDPDTRISTAALFFLKIYLLYFRKRKGGAVRGRGRESQADFSLSTELSHDVSQN